MKLIVGLGNPGREYAGTRHNVGFDVIDELAKRNHTKAANRIGRALTARITVNGEKIILAKPQTFMNLSGEAVSHIARREKIEPSEILVVYDDMALPLGKLRIRPQGSAGGHNGMKSIIAHLHTQDFPRLRVGIDSSGRGAVNHVLSKFRKAERGVINDAVFDAADAVEMMLSEGIEPAMNRYNKSATE